MAIGVFYVRHAFSFSRHNFNVSIRFLLYSCNNIYKRSTIDSTLTWAD